jgi:hypothetical protein
MLEACPPLCLAGRGRHDRGHVIRTDPPYIQVDRLSSRSSIAWRTFSAMRRFALVSNRIAPVSRKARLTSFQSPLCARDARERIHPTSMKRAGKHETNDCQDGDSSGRERQADS